MILDFIGEGFLIQISLKKIFLSIEIMDNNIKYFCYENIVCPEKVEKVNKINRKLPIMNPKLEKIKDYKKDTNNESCLRGECTRLDNPKFIKKIEGEETLRFDYIDSTIQEPDNIILPFPRGGNMTRKKYNKNDDENKLNSIRNERIFDKIEIDYD